MHSTVVEIGKTLFTEETEDRLSEADLYDMKDTSVDYFDELSSYEGNAELVAGWYEKSGFLLPSETETAVKIGDAEGFLKKAWEEVAKRMQEVLDAGEKAFVDGSNEYKYYGISATAGRELWTDVVFYLNGCGPMSDIDLARYVLKNDIKELYIGRVFDYHF